ncbi:MAG: GspH/FimT family pseudopilin [Pseudomonadales bacterium]|jgi:type IV fimbrial biogenesis protein FimT|nr:GspH/FimT family pseudopilin [Pseudomonadales bacterium]
MHGPGSGGWTLAELLVTLAVAALLGAVAVPGMTGLLERTRAETTLTRVQAAVQFTRTAAVTSGSAAVLCPVGADGRCGGDWSEGFTVFLDRDRDARRDEDEPLLRRFPGVEPGARLQFRAFRTGRFLRMRPNGQTDWQNGRLLYCPPADSAAEPAEVVINVQGRARAVRGAALRDRCRR